MKACIVPLRTIRAHGFNLSPEYYLGSTSEQETKIQLARQHVAEATARLDARVKQRDSDNARAAHLVSTSQVRPLS